MEVSVNLRGSIDRMKGSRRVHSSLQSVFLRSTMWLRQRAFQGIKSDRSMAMGCWTRWNACGVLIRLRCFRIHTGRRLGGCVLRMTTLHRILGGSIRAWDSVRCSKRRVHSWVGHRVSRRSLCRSVRSIVSVCRILLMTDCLRLRVDSICCYRCCGCCYYYCYFDCCYYCYCCACFVGDSKRAKLE